MGSSSIISGIVRQHLDPAVHRLIHKVWQQVGALQRCAVGAAEHVPCDRGEEDGSSKEHIYIPWWSTTPVVLGLLQYTACS